MKKLIVIIFSLFSIQVYAGQQEYTYQRPVFDPETISYVRLICKISENMEIQGVAKTAINVKDGIRYIINQDGDPERYVSIRFVRVTKAEYDAYQEHRGFEDEN